MLFFSHSRRASPHPPPFPAPPPPSPTSPDAWQKAQSPLLLTLLGSSLGVDPSSICDFTLSLYDVQPSSLSGAYDEFITSARIDNLFGCYVSLEALLEYVRDGEDVEDEDISGEKRGE